MALRAGVRGGQRLSAADGRVCGAGLAPRSQRPPSPPGAAGSVAAAAGSVPLAAGGGGGRRAVLVRLAAARAPSRARRGSGARRTSSLCRAGTADSGLVPSETGVISLLYYLYCRRVFLSDRCVPCSDGLWLLLLNRMIQWVCIECSVKFFYRYLFTHF